MFMNGSQDSDSHSPLMVYIRSRSAARQRNFARSKQTSRRSNPGLSKSTKGTTSSTGAIQGNGQTMIMETMAVNPTAADGGTADHLMKQPPLALIRPTEKTPTIGTRLILTANKTIQGEINSFTSGAQVHSVVHHLFDTSRYLTESVQTVFHFAHMTNHPRQNWMNHCNNTWLRHFQVWLRHVRPRSQSYTPV